MRTAAVNSARSGHRLAARIGLIGGPILASSLALWPPAGFDQPLANMAAVATLMAVWWITEAVPLAATALLPLVLFPLLKIMPAADTAANYGDSMIFLFLGGFLIALAIEDSGLHRRLALKIVSLVGEDPRRIVLGFMLASGALSMWLSNTATTLMLLPIAMSVLLAAEATSSSAANLPASGRREPAGSPSISDATRDASLVAPNTANNTLRFGASLMLAVAYGANIGGVATIIGTPPNIYFRQFFNNAYTDEPPISFGGWMLFATPYSVVLLLVGWWLMTHVALRLNSEPILGGRGVIAEELARLGPVRSEEWRVLIVFVITALLWIFREPVPGWGWASLLDLGRQDFGGKPVTFADDATVAIGMTLVCFLVPSGRGDGQALLTWQAAARVPWGILLLFGGGVALAEGMDASGLSQLLGGRLAGGLAGMGDVPRTAAIAAGVTGLTEVTSNLACVQMILPVLQGTSDALGTDPKLLMVPAVIAASSGFMMPVGTPPNAIAYGSGRVRMADMLRVGLLLNLAAIVLVVFLATLFLH